MLGASKMRDAPSVENALSRGIGVHVAERSSQCVLYMRRKASPPRATAKSVLRQAYAFDKLLLTFGFGSEIRFVLCRRIEFRLNAEG